MAATYDLTAQETVELNSTITVTETVETEIPLGAMLEEYNRLPTMKAEIQAANAAQIAALDARRAELHGVLAQIKTDNNLTFALANP